MKMFSVTFIIGGIAKAEVVQAVSFAAVEEGVILQYGDSTEIVSIQKLWEL